MGVFFNTTALNGGTASPAISFTSAPIYYLSGASGGAPGAIATADFNLDGKPDIVIANNGENTISVILGR